jgi:hypothetical protein
LKRNGARVETFVFGSDDLFYALFSDDNTSVALREIVLLLEWINGEDKGVDYVRDHIDDHLTDVLLLSLNNEDNSL